MKLKYQPKRPIRAVGKIFTVIVAVASTVFCATGMHAQNPSSSGNLSSNLLSQLTTAGLAITANQREKLPLPMLVPGQSPEVRQRLLENISGAAGWERFSRDSAVAPMFIDIDYVKDTAGERIGHKIHVVFVVHAPLSKLRDRTFMQQAFGQRDELKSPDGFRYQELKPEELRELGIEIDSTNQEGFAFFEANLLNRVKLRGVVRMETVEQENSLTVAWSLDSRFDDKPQRRNSSSKLVSDGSGTLSVQPLQSYSGCGGYLSLTQIDPHNDIVLIESWTILHEPSDWFQGSNLLRSKLPLTIQESVRNFRRKLAGREISEGTNP